INAFGGQQVDRASVLAILPDSTHKEIGSIAFGNCADCLDGFAFVYNDSVLVDKLRDVDEINFWLTAFAQPEFSLTGNLQTLSGAGRLSGNLPLCAIGLEVVYSVFNNTANTTTEFATQIGCLEIVTNCQPQLTADLDCQNDRLLLDANLNGECIPPNAAIYWSDASGNRVGEGESVELPLTGNLGRFTWTIADDCCEISEHVVVENPPFLSVGMDTLICENEPLILSGVGGRDHYWEQLGIAEFQDSLLVFSEAKAENTGTYVLHGFSEEGCEDTDTINLIVNVPPVPILDLADACIGDTLFFGLANDSLFQVINWSSPQGFVFQSPFLPNLQSEDFGTYAVFGIDSAQCETNISFEVEASIPPEVEIEYFEICDSLTAYLFPENYSYLWETGDTINQLTRQEEGTVEVTIRTGSGCVSILPIEFMRSDTGNVTLDIVQPACPNDFGSIEFIPTNPDVPIIYSIDGGTTYSLFPTFNDLDTGIYNIVTQSDLGCTDSMQVEIIAPPELGVQILSEPLEVRPNTPIQLAARTQGNVVEFQWVPKEINTGINTTDFIATNNLDIRAIVKDDRGCFASDGIPLTIVLGEIYVPNAFSPNSDIWNEYFTFFSDNDSGEFVEKLHIYDRWGTLVFEKSNFELNVPELGWDGRFNGNPSPIGVYAYRALIRFGDGSKQVIKGDVSLFR
ncbi:MAG: gliding motility-associated C-terminal domain-containing protein, partial [Bacteroidota bacterium]